MEELKLLITNMRTDIESKFMSMESRLSQMEDKITSKVNMHMNQKFEGLNRDLHDLRSRIENQEKRLYYLEKSSVERNLVFFGIRENEKTYFDLQSSIVDIIEQKLRVPIQASEIQSVKRIGKKQGRCRPISVVMTTLGGKINILKNKKHLEGTGIYITHEFPAPILEKRKGFKVQMKKEIEKGNIAYIQYDKLVIKEKTTDNTNKKRQLSLSPIQVKPSTSTSTANQDIEGNTAQSNWKTSHSAKKYRTHKNSMMAYIKHNNEA